MNEAACAVLSFICAIMVTGLVSIVWDWVWP